jgi:hypothetical protein
MVVVLVMMIGTTLRLAAFTAMRVSAITPCE